jgi:diacylglycerol kinase family enzyme
MTTCRWAEDPAAHPVIRNPVAGRPGSRRRAERLVDQLAARGYPVHDTQGPGHAEDLARDLAAAGAAGLILVGGDGTLFEALPGIPAHLPFTQFPTGTVNLLARGAGLPRKAADFLAMLDQGRLRPLALPRCNGRPFHSVASCGYDSVVVSEVNPRLKRWIQEGAYAWRAFSGYWRYQPPAMRVWLDGVEVGGPLLGVLMGNVPYFGGPQVIFPAADLSRPDLEVVLLEGPARRRLWKYVFGMLVGSLPRMGGAVYRTCATVRIETDPPLAVELDGDGYGHSPVTIDFDPEPRRLLVPVRSSAA